MKSKYAALILVAFFVGLTFAPEVKAQFQYLFASAETRALKAEVDAKTQELEKKISLLEQRLAALEKRK